MTDKKLFIAKNVLKLINKGELVNLGAGIPYLITGLLKPEDEIWIQAECGTINPGPKAAPNQIIPSLIAPDTSFGTLNSNGYCFDSQAAFGMIRGGHLDVTVLGAMQVAENGDMANWDVPGKALKGMGGAMDLAVGAKKLIVAMEHCTKDGLPKILKKCTYPLTCRGKVDYIVTEYCVIKVEKDGLSVIKMNPDITKEKLQSITEAKLNFAENMENMEE